MAFLCSQNIIHLISVWRSSVYLSIIWSNVCQSVPLMHLKMQNMTQKTHNWWAVRVLCPNVFGTCCCHQLGKKEIWVYEIWKSYLSTSNLSVVLYNFNVSVGVRLFCLMKLTELNTSFSIQSPYWVGLILYKHSSGLKLLFQRCENPLQQKEDFYPTSAQSKTSAQF